MAYGDKTKLLWQNPLYREHMSNVHRGKHFSQETRKKMSKVKKGKKPYQMTDKIKDRISRKIKLFFQEHPEARKALSESRKGKKHPISEETRRKIGNANKGKYRLEEINKKSSATKQGISLSEWTHFVSSDNERERKKIEVKLWKKSCMVRDNFTCQICGKRGGKLVVHHINNFADFIELRTTLSNGITMCQECHRQFHKIYGYSHNTKEQLEEFFNDN
jgi:hypothetical protein